MPVTFVLDTNAWLDLLVFEDPALEGLVTSIAEGRVAIAVDDRALDELTRVLRYEALRLDTSAAETHLATVRRLSTRVDVPPLPLPLPRCRDPDDQMFLEIAVASRAAALLTRDAELLRMARRMARDYPLAIVAPAGWRDVLEPQMSKR